MFVLNDKIHFKINCKYPYIQNQKKNLNYCKNSIDKSIPINIIEKLTKFEN